MIKIGNAFHKDLGWAKIIHPFHPLRGQRFKILKKRKITHENTLILQGTHKGWFYIPQEWTDKSDPSVYTYTGASSVLSFEHLLELADLIKQFRTE